MLLAYYFRPHELYRTAIFTTTTKQQQVKSYLIIANVMYLPFPLNFICDFIIAIYRIYISTFIYNFRLCMEMINNR